MDLSNVWKLGGNSFIVSFFKNKRHVPISSEMFVLSGGRTLKECCHRDDADDVTDQAEAVCVQRLWLIWLPGRQGDVPSLQLRPYLCWTEEDHGVTMATVYQLHQVLLIVPPVRTDGWRPYT